MARRTRDLQTVYACSIHIPAHTRWDRVTRTDVLVPAADHRITLRMDLATAAEAAAIDLERWSTNQHNRAARMQAAAKLLRSAIAVCR